MVKFAAFDIEIALRYCRRRARNVARFVMKAGWPAYLTIAMLPVVVVTGTRQAPSRVRTGRRIVHWALAAQR